MGASVAYHLGGARLARRRRPRSRATGRARGAPAGPPVAFAPSMPRAMNVRLSLLARDKLRRFEAETGVDPGLLAVRLSLARGRPSASSRTLRAGQAVQHAEGLHEAGAARAGGRRARSIPRSRLDEHRRRRLLSHRRLHPAAAASWRATSRPRAGSAFGWQWGVEVTGFSLRADEIISAVRTSRGTDRRSRRW